MSATSFRRRPTATGTSAGSSSIASFISGFRSMPSLFTSSSVLIVLALAMLCTVSARDACDADEFAQQPCRCCKMDCWYSVAGSAAHELGHIPGQAGEQEALATLRLIRACMIAECTPVCESQLMKKRRLLSKGGE